MLAKSKLNSTEVSISKALIDSSISHNEFVLINNMIKEYDDMKEEIKNWRPKQFKSPTRKHVLSVVLDLTRNVFKYASNSLKFPAGWRYWVLIRMFFDFLLIISAHRASISALLALRSCLTLNVKDS